MDGAEITVVGGGDTVTPVALPVALAKAVIKSGDIKFLAVAGFTVVAPGIDNKRCFAARERVYVIPGTSDMLESQRGRRVKGVGVELNLPAP